MKKLWIPALIVLGLGGFAVVKVMTAKKTAETEYRAVVRVVEGGWAADIMQGGKVVQTLGPSESEEAAAQAAATYLDGLDVVAFYTLIVEELSPGQYNWFFEGWSRGTKVLEQQGPYASEAIANAAGVAWAKKTAGEM